MKGHFLEASSDIHGNALRESIMNTRPFEATLTSLKDPMDCTWCGKGGETVTISFASGFLQDAPLCWKCLQQAVRVNHKQSMQAAATSQPALGSAS